MSVITQQILEISKQIPPQVKLIAVSKTFPAAAIREAYKMGIRDFGESRVQEALEKQQELADLKDICWHFIGHLQSNKAKKIIQHFQWIHSVDSLKLAQTLDKLAAELKLNPQILLQVKILPDPNKYGWTKESLITDLPELSLYSHIQIKGLMTILPLGLLDEQKIKTFQDTQKFAQEIREKMPFNITMNELSMGMSGDYLLAIKAGATMIRLGTIIFGHRS